MVDPRDRDGADDPEAGGTAGDGASDAGSDAPGRMRLVGCAWFGCAGRMRPERMHPKPSEPEFGSSDWFYHQLSGGRRRAREPGEAADAGRRAAMREPGRARLSPHPRRPVRCRSEPPIGEPAIPSFDPQFPDVTAPFAPPATDARRR